MDIARTGGITFDHDDVIFASGANHQLLYVIPALDMVIVRFGRRTQDWNDSEFLSRVTEG